MSGFGSTGNFLCVSGSLCCGWCGGNDKSDGGRGNGDVSVVTDEGRVGCALRCWHCEDGGPARWFGSQRGNLRALNSTEGGPASPHLV